MGELARQGKPSRLFRRCHSLTAESKVFGARLALTIAIGCIFSWYAQVSIVSFKWLLLSLPAVADATQLADGATDDEAASQPTSHPVGIAGRSPERWEPVRRGHAVGVVIR